MDEFFEFLSLLIIVGIMCIAIVGGVHLLFGSDSDTNEFNKSIDGIKYRIVTIEGQQFIATKTYGGYVTFAGPIDVVAEKE